MRIAPYVAVALVSVVAVACGKSEDSAPKPPPPSSKLSKLNYTEIPATKGYPGKTCPVHDKELATLGHPPYVIAYGNYEVQFCSKDCLNEFADDPETYVLKIHPKAIFNK
jgi:YHS domain-containing protein